MIIESLDDWPEGLQPPAWLNEMEILTYEEALALSKLGVPVVDMYLDVCGGDWNRWYDLEDTDIEAIGVSAEYYDILYLPR